MTEKIDIKKFFGSFFQVVPWLKDIRTMAAIALVLFVGFTLWRAYGRRDGASNIHKPTCTVLPFAKVEKLDQTSTQVLIEEKTWEVGLGGGILNWDNKSGMFAGGWVKKKF
jgi:hypothetical protein